jgi:ketopantoate hydroxymethyltransferase
MTKAVMDYQTEVKAGTFPTKENSFIIDSAVLEQVKNKLS